MERTAHPARTLAANHLVVGAFYAIEAAKREAAERVARERRDRREEER